LQHPQKIGWFATRLSKYVKKLAGLEPVPTEGDMRLPINLKIIGAFLFVFAAFYFFPSGHSNAQELKLADLIDEALKNNPDLLASQAKIDAAGYRVPQSKTLPDPMFSVGYQNEGLTRYTYGEELGSQWMFGASQEFPFPGKLALKGSMAESDLASLKAMDQYLRAKTTDKVTELYLDLFLSYKTIDLLKDKDEIFARIEDMSLARYSTGKAMQEEVLMAQTEKYMLLEKEQMLKQKIQSIEAMLRAALGRKDNASMGRPVEPANEVYPFTSDEAVNIALNNSSDIKSRNKMLEAAGYKVSMAEKEYYPDFTVNAGYAKRTGPFMDMYSATVTVNLPIFRKTKLEPAVNEAKASVAQAEQELESAKLMIASAVQDNVSMVRSSEKLMELYKNGLIPKNAQSLDAALAGYSTGASDVLTLISLSKTLLDYETGYWNQFVERAKAVARLEAITETQVPASGGDQGEK
jgi:outer membrane protein, heavy metal efflux system